MNTWTGNLRESVDLFLQELVDLHKQYDTDSDSFSSMAKQCMDSVHDFYQKDLPVASLLDSSHLVARYVGSSELHPTFFLMSKLCGNLDKSIRGIAQSIFHMRASSTEKVKWPTELMPNLSGIVPGSLVIGVRIGTGHESDEGQSDMFADELKLMAADVEHALDGVATIGKHLAGGVVSESFREEYEDPATRDTILSAAAKIAPTGQLGGIREVVFQRSNDAIGERIPLTTDARKLLNRELNRQEKRAKPGVFSGVVRAVDLDSNRFVLRQVSEWGAIRCIHQPRGGGTGIFLSELLNATVEVSGVYESAPGKVAPRLMRVDSVDVITPAAQQNELEI